jgi:hypothetical protein
VLTLGGCWSEPCQAKVPGQKLEVDVKSVGVELYYADMGTCQCCHVVDSVAFMYTYMHRSMDHLMPLSFVDRELVYILKYSNVLHELQRGNLPSRQGTQDTPGCVMKCPVAGRIWQQRRQAQKHHCIPNIRGRDSCMQSILLSRCNIQRVRQE